jgi:hypothetical protein
MRDSAFKSGFYPSAGGVNMDELLIFGDLGKRIDPRLINQYPGAVPQVHADLPALRGKGLFQIRHHLASIDNILVSMFHDREACKGQNITGTLRARIWK